MVRQELSEHVPVARTFGTLSRTQDLRHQHDRRVWNVGERVCDDAMISRRKDRAAQCGVTANASEDDTRSGRQPVVVVIDDIRGEGSKFSEVDCVARSTQIATRHGERLGAVSCV